MLFVVCRLLFLGVCLLRLSCGGFELCGVLCVVWCISFVVRGLLFDAVWLSLAIYVWLLAVGCVRFGHLLCVVRFVVC